MTDEHEPQCGGPKEACLIVGCTECGTTAESLHRYAISIGEKAEALAIELTNDRATLERFIKRVRSDDDASECPFCAIYSATGHAQQVPMCRLCALESTHSNTLQELSIATRQREEMEKLLRECHSWVAGGLDYQSTEQEARKLMARIDAALANNKATT